MKSYTDIEQSKRLAEILPINTADCCYIKYCTSDNDEWRYEGQPPMFLGEIPITEITAEHIPCWSLAALLGIMPSVIKRKGKRMFLTLEKAGAYNLYYKSPDRLDELWETKEEPIDACVEMIEFLHEENLI